MIHQPPGQLDVVVNVWTFAILVNVDDPLLAQQKLWQTFVDGYWREFTHRLDAHWPRARRNEASAAVISQEQHSTWACKNLGECAHCCAPKVFIISGRQRADKS